MQTQTDVLGIPLERSRHLEATALGAAALAGLGIGLFQDTTEIAAMLPQPEVVEPAWTEDRREAVYARWRRFVAHAASFSSGACAP
jgi:glycerol kinase